MATKSRKTTQASTRGAGGSKGDASASSAKGSGKKRVRTKSTTGNRRTSSKTPTKRSSKTSGKHLVIVESPTKAKTINRYVGSGYVVMASVGHVRDLPTKGQKGKKSPVPGVDLDNNFKPTYEILPEKKKTVSDLKKAAKEAMDVWFATDLDREGEAIAWHLAESLNVPIGQAKRVVFNAITKSEIEHAFANPRLIDENRVNAQQARRILDRIVGFQVSPLLWKKVTSGLSAGRVQSVAVRLVVERERQIGAFIPEEFWRITARLSVAPEQAAELGRQWREWRASASDGKDRTIKEQTAWLSEHGCFSAELVKLDGEPVKLIDRDQALAAARLLGFVLDETREREDPKAKGPAQNLCVHEGHLETAPASRIQSIQTKRTTSRPPAPFITSTLQQAAANRLGYALQRTMRIAQQLYEGVDIHGQEGQIGLITYMRTDSTHLSNEALDMARSYIGTEWGEVYLPDKPNFYSSPNKAAQEAHEAIRPTDVSITPRRVRRELSDEQFRLYQIIWERFCASQMTPAQWDATTVMIEVPGDPVALLKATGRTLVFDGFYKATGIPTTNGDSAILPPISEGQTVVPLDVEPKQLFTSPPPRYTEASLQKKLEEEGIGRPSTYAPIIGTIQNRKYVQPVAPRDRRLMATDLGVVVTDMLVEAFPKVMDLAYTRDMEDELDKIESEHHDWLTMLRQFYGPFKESLERAHKELTHAKAVTEPAPHTCGKCGTSTVYRFGRNGKFLSCSRYPDCDYGAPIDSDGNPMEPQASDIACPDCQGDMSHRVGRFGPFLGCTNYPNCKGIVKLDPKKGTVVMPKPPPLLTKLVCPKCEKPMNMRRSKRGPWLSCSGFPKCRGRLGWTKLEADEQERLETALRAHEVDHPIPIIRTVDGRPVDETYVPRLGDAAKDTQDEYSSDVA